MTPGELTFNLNDWVLDHCTVVERSGAEWLVGCPWCGREKLAINVARRKWRCFVCEFSGHRPLYFVAEVLGCTLDAAAREVNRYAVGALTGPIKDLTAQASAWRDDAELPVGSFPPTGPLGADQLRYWTMRGFPPDHLVHLGVLQACGDGSGSKADRMLTGRLLFPIWNSRSTPVSWAARSINPDARAKVLNAPRPCADPDHAPGCTCKHREWGLPEVPYGATSGEVLLGLHLLRRGDRAVLVEGVTDVAACGAGFVASLGATISPAQVALLVRAGVRQVVVLYDPDPAGDKGRIKATKAISPYIEVLQADLPVGSDPGSLGRDVCLRLADQAREAGLVSVVRSAPVSEIRRPSPFIRGL